MKLTKVTLGEISKEKGRYGIEASAVDYSDNLDTFLRISDINADGTINYNGLKSVVHERVNYFRLNTNDIAFARTGNNVGKNYFYDERDGDFVYGSFLIKFSLNPDKVNPRYIKYYCLSDEYKSWVKKHVIGSTRGGLNSEILSNMEINLPPRKIQDKLVSVLDSLENKRRINLEINEVLLQLADVIFQKMFTKNNSNNRGYLSDLIYLKVGKSPKELHTGDIPCYGTGGVMNYVDQVMYDKETVLIPRRGSINNIFYINKPFWCVDTLYYMKPKISHSMKYIYHFLRSIDLRLLNPGFTVPGLTKEIINNITITIPSREDLLIFEQSLKPIYEEIDNNINEINRLLEMRKSIFSNIYVEI